MTYHHHHSRHFANWVRRERPSSGDDGTERASRVHKIQVQELKVREWVAACTIYWLLHHRLSLEPLARSRLSSPSKSSPPSFASPPAKGALLPIRQLGLSPDEIRNQRKRMRSGHGSGSQSNSGTRIKISNKLCETVTGQKVTLIVWTQRVLGFRLFCWLLSIAVNFLRACGENYSIAATRNAWKANLVCLCVMEE
jgi:hypothetical protein